MGAVRSSGWATVTNQRAYLFRAVTNRCNSVKRSEVRRRARELRSAPSEALSASEGSLDAHRALSVLSPNQRAVIYLAHWEDRTPAQIAELVGSGEGSVREQLARSPNNLREYFDERS